jgi:hypothetical protein
VQGAGTDRALLTLTGGGRLARANLFGGSLSDADVTIDIDRGTLRASFNGRVQGIEPPFRRRSTIRRVGQRFGRRPTTVRDLLIRTPESPTTTSTGASMLKRRRSGDSTSTKVESTAHSTTASRR